MKIDILGVKINIQKKSEILQAIKNRLEAGQTTFIVTPYSESIVTAQTDQQFQQLLNTADFALPDGVGILWVAHFLELNSKNPRRKIFNLIQSLFYLVFFPNKIRTPIAEKISGSDFIWDLTELASKNNFSIYLLGGFGDTPQKAGLALRNKYPNLKIVGANNPSSNAKNDAKIIGDINSSNADILFVALGARTQEFWIQENLPNLRIRLAIGLGGTFDYLAGKRPYRPNFWASRGLEWLWRLLTQPWRIIRIFRGVGGLIYYSFKSSNKKI